MIDAAGAARPRRRTSRGSPLMRSEHETSPGNARGLVLTHGGRRRAPDGLDCLIDEVARYKSSGAESSPPPARAAR
ncbi:hypothetical protein EVAR_22128_1 [Eumeta japonica]|uniref:Uncharacterized protein n=1 Tax=Eumeta variegata TaxID=151549 RepID=A0A4C1W236_EUMVA|nr:hypothetical protein EVAR_22128_1 [Eumeta japonica]